MKTVIKILIVVFWINVIHASVGITPEDYNSKISLLQKQLLKKYDLIGNKFPEYTVNGKWKFRNKANWLTGFMGGELWIMVDLTSDRTFYDKAISFADSMIQYASIDYTHDMGFMFLPTVVEAYKRTGNGKYLAAAKQAAIMLSKRFNRKGNFIRAWGKLGTDKNAGKMIIDTMMNLELLFWVANELGMPEFYDIAYKHAITCMEKTIRKDYSAFHVVEFDAKTGKLKSKFTHQGYADSSAWARGQAWGIYGFALAYKYTNDERFLNISKGMADYFIQHLNDDFVPNWDLNLTGNDIVRDASAAAIGASGLYLLADLSGSKSDYNRFKNVADKIVESLLNNYLFINSKRDGEEGLLIHTVYNYKKDWGIDESFPCGDYYLLEATKKYNEINKTAFIGGENLREKVNINKGWFYLQKSFDSIDELKKYPNDYIRVDLPHSWNKFDAVDPVPGYRRDISWYQKYLELSNVRKDKRYILHFEAVNLKAEVYVNGKFAGSHTGGYVGFDIDISDYLVNGTNEILVKADNSIDKNLIPSQKSDFFIYGGITRDVWLNILPENYIQQLHIATIDVAKKSAELLINSKIELNTPEEHQIRFSIIDAKNNIVQSGYVENVTGNVSLTMKVDSPHLWDIEDPYLYRIKAFLVTNGKTIDSTEEKFGIRYYEFKKHGAFYLNGRRVLLRGTHRHEEFAGEANALSNERHWQDMKEIKEMGANFVRLAHYPQDPEIYEACDSLGILVWDELPWCRGGVGGEEWKENAKRLFREQINQNYNHPSIILWSIGNEMYWLPDFPGGGNIDSLRKFATELNDIAHELDPYRLTTCRKFYDGNDITDVFSPSIWAGWYSGVYKSYEKAIKTAIKKYDRFFHAEYGGASHMGRHVEFPITGDGMLNPDKWAESVNQTKVKNIAKIGDWSENYIVDLFDWHLTVSESIPEFTGNAQWAVRDFGTPLRPENAIPYINQKGLFDREGNPKDAYYVFKAHWTENPKFVYIESHTWKEREGKADALHQVDVYSNCSSVELFLNGVSLGEKSRNKNTFPAMGLNWQVKFEPGINILKAVGDGKIVDTLTINYFTEPAGKPEHIEFSKKLLNNGNYLITARVVDKNNRTCLNFNRRVYFSLNGKGKLIENYGTYSKSSIIEFANGKASIEYKYVPFESGIIEARTQDLKGNYYIIRN